LSNHNFQVTYWYENTTKANIELWLSKPMESSTQRNIEVIPTIQPARVTDDSFLNTIWYFNLKPEEKLEVIFRYSGSKQGEKSPKEISKEERQFFLRSTNLIPVNAKVKEQALAIIGDAKTDLDKAKKLYTYITKKFSYSTHFNERGVFSFIKRKKGDCGEFAALFCAYCRALNIPAKILYGTWTLKKFSPHSWSEIYIEGKGWIPVDPSMGRMKLYYHPFTNLTSAIYYGALPNKNQYFGSHEGKRFAFSVEPERFLEPPFEDSTDYFDTVEKSCIAGKEIAWGYESIEGKAPFLQPIYPKIHSKMKKTSYKLLFGNWSGKHLGFFNHLSYKIKTTSFSIGFVILYLELINRHLIDHSTLSYVLPFFSIPLILVGTIFSLLRKEGNALIYVLGLLFALSFLNLIST